MKHTWGNEKITQNLAGKPEKTSQFGRSRRIGMVLFKQGVSCGMVSHGSGQIPRAGSYEQGNQTSGSIKSK
jgi:hypothetical protein